MTTKEIIEAVAEMKAEGLTSAPNVFFEVFFKLIQILRRNFIGDIWI